MLSIADVPLILPDSRYEESEFEGWIAENIRQEEAMPWLSRAFPGPRLGNVAVPTGYRPARAVQINRFFYPPWGACRFGHGHFLASTNQAKAIREAAFGADGSGNGQDVTLNMSTGGLSYDGGGLSTQVRVLRVIPLGRTSIPPPSGQDYTNGLYLITVVDERYTWWWRSFPDLGTPKATSWSSLLDSAGQAVGRPIAADPVPAAYLKADPSLVGLAYEVAPIMIDAICANVGMRLTRTLSGAIKARTPANAVDDHLTSGRNERWTVRAGWLNYQADL